LKFGPLGHYNYQVLPQSDQDLNYALDTLNVKGSVFAFPDQCEQVIKETADLSVPEDYSGVSSVVLSGMGGSALGGRVLSSIIWDSMRIPMVISTDYRLPDFVGPDTLVIVSSYSGNTEETLMAMAEAQKRKARLFILSAGGKLAQISRDQKISSYIFNPRFNPSNQPRMALGYAIMSVAVILSRCGFVKSPEGLDKIPGFLRSRQTESARLLDISRSLLGKIPVLVASEHLKGAAHCFKNQINENAKNYCDFYDLPELNHHLLEGLTYPKTNSDNLIFLFFTSDMYNSEIQKRYPLTAEAVKRHQINFLNWQVAGSDYLSQALDLVQSGSFIAYYLSLLNGVDPGPIPWVDWYKDEIRKMV
jgi:glucose/mannose-6-phosphate isomerase